MGERVRPIICVRECLCSLVRVVCTERHKDQDMGVQDERTRRVLVSSVRREEEDRTVVTPSATTTH